MGIKLNVTKPANRELVGGLDKKGLAAKILSNIQGKGDNSHILNDEQFRGRRWSASREFDAPATTNTQFPDSSTDPFSETYDPMAIAFAPPETLSAQETAADEEVIEQDNLIAKSAAAHSTLSGDLSWDVFSRSGEKSSTPTSTNKPYVINKEESDLNNNASNTANEATAETNPVWQLLMEGPSGNTSESTRVNASNIETAETAEVVDPIEEAIIAVASQLDTGAIAAEIANAAINSTQSHWAAPITPTVKENAISSPPASTGHWAAPPAVAQRELKAEQKVNVSQADEIFDELYDYAVDLLSSQDAASTPIVEKSDMSDDEIDFAVPDFSPVPIARTVEAGDAPVEAAISAIMGELSAHPLAQKDFAPKGKKLTPIAQFDWSTVKSPEFPLADDPYALLDFGVSEPVKPRTEEIKETVLQMIDEAVAAAPALSETAEGESPREQQRKQALANIVRTQKGLVELAVHANGRKITPQYTNTGTMKQVEIAGGARFVLSDSGEQWLMIGASNPQGQVVTSVSFDDDGNFIYVTPGGIETVMKVDGSVETRNVKVSI